MEPSASSNDLQLRVVGRAEIFGGTGILRMFAKRASYYPGEEIVGKVLSSRILII
jgi:hypothetical protein